MGAHSLRTTGADEPEGESSMSVRREPALLLISLLAPTVQALAAFVFAADATTQGVVNAAAVAVAGAITAVMVRAENMVPAITGAAQALIALVVAFGADWDASQQAALMVPIGIIAGYVVRERVVAPVSSTTAVS